MIPHNYIVKIICATYSSLVGSFKGEDAEQARELVTEGVSNLAARGEAGRVALIDVDDENKIVYEVEVNPKNFEAFRKRFSLNWLGVR